MDANKLMIGNYLQDREGRLCRIEELHHKEGVKALCINSSITELPIAPILLTDDWLKKLGFDDTKYKDGYIGIDYNSNMITDFVITKPFTKGVWQYCYAFEFESGGLLRSSLIEFVHELQNLFFALTGEELTIKQ